MSPTRIQHILCPVDASEPSAQACLLAVGIARWSGAQVTVLHVSRADLHGGAENCCRRPPSSNARKPGRRCVPGCECSSPRRHWLGVRVDQVVTTGAPAKEILAYAAQAPADLIVMGTHGTSGFEHLVLGSVAEKVLRRAPCPVLTVPPQSVASSRLPFTHVLCALDFSDCSLAALEFAMTAALGSGAALTLTHVLEWPWHEPPPPAFDELPHAEAVALADYRRRRECEALARLEALRPDGVARSLPRARQPWATLRRDPAGGRRGTSRPDCARRPRTQPRRHGPVRVDDEPGRAPRDLSRLDTARLNKIRADVGAENTHRGRMNKSGLAERTGFVVSRAAMDRIRPSILALTVMVSLVLVPAHAWERSDDPPPATTATTQADAVANKREEQAAKRRADQGRKQERAAKRRDQDARRREEVAKRHDTDAQQRQDTAERRTDDESDRNRQAASNDNRRKPSVQPRHPAAARLPQMMVFIGGYLYDPFFGPYPWWPPAVYPYRWTPRLRAAPRCAGRVAQRRGRLCGWLLRGNCRRFRRLVSVAAAPAGWTHDRAVSRRHIGRSTRASI